MCLENSRREFFFLEAPVCQEMDLPGTISEPIKIHLSPGKINRWCDFDHTSFRWLVLVVAIRNWTLLIPAVPPPAAGHENPGKLK